MTASDPAPTADLPPDASWPQLVARLSRYVRRRVADPHAAEDLIQDVLTKVAARLRSAPPTGPWLAWTLRVARHSVIDHYRRRPRVQKSVPEDAGEVVDPLTPEATQERAGLLASFRAFVHGLPPEQREAVLLTEYEGLTQKAVADQLGVPLSTVKSRVQRGRQRLGQALQACCTFEFDRRGHIVDWRRRPGAACLDC